MKKSRELYFNIDTPSFLDEISKNDVLRFAAVPFSILKTKLGMIAKRAAELNDPKLNVLMLEMKLYEVNHRELSSKIKFEKGRIEKKCT